MGLPKDFPPVEIIQGLERELKLPFQYFMVSIEGEIEALFGNDNSQQIVSFETKITSLTEHEMPSFESLMGGMEQEDKEAVKEALKDMVMKIEEENEVPLIEYNEVGQPKFDEGKFYCP
jgi:hypothetical protein